MNAKRRKQIEKIIANLEEIRETISSLRDEEEDAYNNLPETIQESERGENMQSAYEALETAFDDADSSFDDIIDSLNEAISY